MTTGTGDINSEGDMAIDSIGVTGTNGYPNIIAPASSTIAASAVSDPNATGSTSQTSTSTSATGDNSSSLALAISQALLQINANSSLASLLTPSSQQSTSDFTSSLLASLQGSSALASSASSSAGNSIASLLGYGSGHATTPVALDQSSPTVKLQGSIQNLITQLGGNSSTDTLLGITPDSGTSSTLGGLQQSFNSLITSSGGNPDQASLQSFLKTVAANIQGSLSIGSLFSASA
jgi:hypothetical protein